MKLRHLKLRLIHKILGGFLTVIGLMAIVAIVGMVQLEKASSRTDAVYRENVKGIEYSLLTSNHMIASLANEKRAMLAADAGQRKALIQASRDAMEQARAAMANYRATLSSDSAARAWAPVEARVESVIAGREHVLALIEKGDSVGAALAASEMQATVEEMNQALNEAAGHNSQLAFEARKAADDAAGSSRLLLIGLTAVAAVVAIGGGTWLARSISGAASQAAAAAARLARGDVNVQVDTTSSDEMGDLGRAFREMTGYLREMVGAAEEVASGNLAATVQPRGEDDALGNALRRMVGNLGALVSTVQENALAILSASEQLEESSNQMAQATNQIATAINEVTTSTVALNSLAHDSTAEVERLAAGSQQLSASAQSSAESARASQLEAASMGERIARASEASLAVARTAESSKESALEGRRAVAQAVTSMESIAEAVARASGRGTQLGELGGRSCDIGKAGVSRWSPRASAASPSARAPARRRSPSSSAGCRPPRAMPWPPWPMACAMSRRAARSPRPRAMRSNRSSRRWGNRPGRCRKLPARYGSSRQAPATSSMRPGPSRRWRAIRPTAPPKWPAGPSA